jgi:HPt (histidine-containing phosphotransfer) domain-containing protein
MGDEEKLSEQVASLGARYLARTLGELRRVGELLAEVEAGSTSAIKELEHAAHKIHGSSAMFGFQALSEQAGEIEHITGHLGGRSGADHLHGLSEDELRRRLSTSVAQLDRVARATAQNFGLDPNVG